VHAEVMMGGMMGGAGMGGWIALWSVLGFVAIVAGGLMVAHLLGIRRGSDQPQVRAGESAAVTEAKDTLRRRYARGEISREEYLQGKVEIEDLPAYADAAACEWCS
jgi:putative membrane protein